MHSVTGHHAQAPRKSPVSQAIGPEELNFPHSALTSSLTRALILFVKVEASCHVRFHA